MATSSWSAASGTKPTGRFSRHPMKRPSSCKASNMAMVPRVAAISFSIQLLPPCASTNTPIIRRRTTRARATGIKRQWPPQGKSKHRPTFFIRPKKSAPPSPTVQPRLTRWLALISAWKRLTEPWRDKKHPPEAICCWLISKGLSWRTKIMQR